jgi:hypothetical protein
VPPIFISHASVDLALAELLAKHIDECEPQRKRTFLSSRPGDIQADAEWVEVIQKNLRNADAYVILLTIHSVDRPWVSFEAGAAWYSQKTCILVRAGLAASEIPEPLSFKQVYSLEAVDGTQAVFNKLSLQPININQFVDNVLTLTSQKKLAGQGEHAWEGVEFQGTFYAWAGPMLELNDKDGVPFDPQLIEAIKLRGREPIFADPANLSYYFGKRYCQVFATDKKNWRRPVVQSSSNFLLLVKPEDVKR